MSTSKCTKCEVEKDLDDFEYRKNRGVHLKKCRTCMNKVKQKHYRDNSLNYKIKEARRRADKRGLDFDITKDDIVVPEYCPLIGIKLNVNENGAGPDSPSIDRIDSNKGYVKDNIWVISHRANTVKNDASFEELFTLVYNLKKQLKKMGKLDEEFDT